MSLLIHFHDINFEILNSFSVWGTKHPA